MCLLGSLFALALLSHVFGSGTRGVILSSGFRVLTDGLWFNELRHVLRCPSGFYRIFLFSVLLPVNILIVKTINLYSGRFMI